LHLSKAGLWWQDLTVGRSPRMQRALLLGATDRAIGLVRRFTACFIDHRVAEQVEHSLATLVSQRVFALALGYEDLVDHDTLRHDPVLAAVAGKLTAKRADGAPLAGKSTLNRLEHAPAGEATRYHKIGHDGAAIERLFVELFLDAHKTPPEEIVLDLDATDDPLHGAQEGRFFHGYYGCYCYLPLYVFCGDHLLAAKLRRSNSDACAGAVEEVARLVSQIRARWPQVRIILRADSGFARDGLMVWAEQHRVDYVLGLARNSRLVGAIAPELALAKAEAEQTGKPARCFKDFRYQTLDSWSCARRVVGKAEQLLGSDAEPSPNPRFVVTNLAAEAWAPRELYERLYCSRGGMENRIKECQLDLFADRTSTRAMRSNRRQRRCRPAMVCLHGLCAARGPAPDRSAGHAPRPGHRRHHPPQAPQDRRSGPRLGAPGHHRHGLRPSLAAGLGHRPPGPDRGRGLTTTQTALSRHLTMRRCPRAAAHRRARHPPRPPPDRRTPTNQTSTRQHAMPKLIAVRNPG
jgi:Transposase DDE domain group 1